MQNHINNFRLGNVDNIDHPLTAWGFHDEVNGALPSLRLLEPLADPDTQSEWESRKGESGGFLESPQKYNKPNCCLNSEDVIFLSVVGLPLQQGRIGGGGYGTNPDNESCVLFLLLHFLTISPKKILAFWNGFRKKIGALSQHEGSTDDSCGNFSFFSPLLNFFSPQHLFKETPWPAFYEVTTICNLFRRHGAMFWISQKYHSLHCRDVRVRNKIVSFLAWIDANSINRVCPKKILKIIKK